MPRAARLSSAFALGVLALLAGALLGELSQRFPAGSVEALALMALGTELVLGLAASGGALLSPEPFAARLGLGAGRLPARSLALLIVGMLALSHGLDGILALSGLREQSSLGEVAERLAGARGGALWIAMIGLAIAPSLGEELLCRGFLQRGLRQRLGAPAAIAISALVFGALHLDPVHSVFAAALGLYLGLAAEWAGSTRASIGCHLVNNLTAVGAMAAFGSEQPLPTISIPLALIVCAGCLWRVRRDGRRSDAVTRE
jgi:membrane protease YdiL (CAAX protease family)